MESGYPLQTLELEEPANVKKALMSPDKAKWKIAMEKEFESLRENNVWKLPGLHLDWRLMALADSVHTVKYAQLHATMLCSVLMACDLHANTVLLGV